MVYNGRILRNVLREGISKEGNEYRFFDTLCSLPDGNTVNASVADNLSDCFESVPVGTQVLVTMEPYYKNKNLYQFTIVEIL